MTPVSKPPPLIGADLARGNGVAALGDSITQGNALVDSGIAGVSWFNQACMASGQRMRYVRNAGISGNTTAQMLARVQTDVIAYAPNWCFVLGGTNDYSQSVPQATIRANLQAIYESLRGAKIQPIPCTLTPRSASAGTAEIDKLNAWIRWYAQTHGYPVCDFAEATTDPATGGWLAGYSSDNTHPITAGVAAMVDKAVTDIAPLFPQTSVYLERATSAGVSMLSNPVFIGDANSDGVANNWTGINTATNAAPSLVADTANVFGNWQQLVVTTGGTKYFDANAITNSWSVGDRISIAGKISTANCIAGSMQASVRVVFQNATGTPSQMYPVYQFTNDVTAWTFYQEAVIPTGTTQVEVQLQANNGTGTVKFGQITLVNMTRQGLV